jgi:phage terminase large subunit-like protein
VRYVNIWYPPPGGKIDFSEPEGELRRLFREYNVVEFCYDPYQLEDMAGRFRNEAIVHTYAFAQGADRLKADKALYDNIRQRRIRHTGEPDLREHILNANAEMGKDGKSLRLVKKSDARKIDAAVALSMARERAALED